MHKYNKLKIITLSEMVKLENWVDHDINNKREIMSTWVLISMNRLMTKCGVALKNIHTLNSLIFH